MFYMIKHFCYYDSTICFYLMHFFFALKQSTKTIKNEDDDSTKDETSEDPDKLDAVCCTLFYL